ncbi:hypothetical protein BMETH_109212091164, partial [methanotrophic bacterial endosymbiont of Bathymodiolus sp.]
MEDIKTEKDTSVKKQRRTAKDKAFSAKGLTHGGYRPYVAQDWALICAANQLSLTPYCQSVGYMQVDSRQ